MSDGIKAGDEVVIVASEDALRMYSCSVRIKKGETYIVDQGNSVVGYHLRDCGFCNHVMPSFVELMAQYDDEDWV